MKQKMKKTRMNVWMNDKKWLWRHPTDEGLEINLMSVAKSICLTMDVDAICNEAEAWVRKKGVEVRTNGPSYMVYPLSMNSSNKRLERMWNRTNDFKGKIKVKQGGIVLKRGKIGRARGGPSYGISLPNPHACCVDTIIHEFAHVVHLYRYNASIVNGKRRPHDLLYNRIMLKMMQAYCGIPESQTNPIALGWSIGNGYAPSIKIRAIHEEMVKSKDPKVMRWFTKSEGLTYEEELIEKKKQKKPRNTRQKGTGEYNTPKGIITIDETGDSWNKYEVSLPNGYNWCDSHFSYCETLKEAYQYLGTYDKDAKQYTADVLDKCDEDCYCGWDLKEE
tara:strand:- start:1407 stop:2408 length:1002 start_codon:yes stop_codon:yes gene_type:complete